jgi:ferrous iron transport protein A
MVLADLKPNETAVIEGFENSPLVLKFLEIGLVPGAEVQFFAKAPLGDPIAVEVMGSKISLRIKEAKSIKIRLV